MQIWISQRSIHHARQHPTTQPEAWSCQSGALASSCHLLPSPGLPLLGHPGTWGHHRWCHSFNPAHRAMCEMPCTAGITCQERSGLAQGSDQYNGSAILNVLLVVAAAHATGAETCSQDSSAAELWPHTLHRCVRLCFRAAMRDATSVGITCLPVLWLTRPMPRECMQGKLCRCAGHRETLGSSATLQHMCAGAASVPRAPGLADLPNVTQAAFWLNRAGVHEKEGDLQVLQCCIDSVLRYRPLTHLCS